jgi:hypothetical protein
LTLERAEKKAMKECQKYAKKGELKAAKSLAKDIVSGSSVMESLCVCECV